MAFFVSLTSILSLVSERRFIPSPFSRERAG